MIRLGLLGCGWIAEQAYLPVIQELDSVKITSIYDLDQHKARHLQQRWQNIKVCETVDTLFSDEIDGVIIATPNYTHTVYSNLALQNGIHVLCEKPVAFHRTDLEKTLELAEKNQLIFLPGFVNRFRPDIRRLRQIIGSGLLGEITRIHASWIRRAGIPRPGTWITRHSTAGGGVLIDLGSHLLDICFMHLDNGAFKEASLKCHSSKEILQMGAQWCGDISSNMQKDLDLIDVETSAAGKIVLHDGVVVEFELDWASDTEEDQTLFEFVGNKASVKIDTLFGFSNNIIRDNISIQVHSEKSLISTEILPIKNNYSTVAFQEMLQYFAQAVKGNSMEYLKPSDALRTVDSIDRLYQSRHREMPLV